MFTIPKRLYDPIIAQLTPLMDTESNRRGWILPAFQAHTQVSSKIDWAGDAYSFTVRLIDLCCKHGEVESGKQALMVLLEAVHKRVGLDSQQQIEELLSQLSEQQKITALEHLQGTSQTATAESKSSFTVTKQLTQIWKRGNKRELAIIAALIGAFALMIGASIYILLPSLGRGSVTPTATDVAVSATPSTTSVATLAAAPLTSVVTVTPQSLPTLTVGIAQFANCVQPDPALALQAQIKAELTKQQVDLGLFAFHTLPEIKERTAARSQPYQVILWGECQGESTNRYNAEWLLSGNSEQSRVAEPPFTQLTWAATSLTLPARVFAAALAYHAGESSLAPVALLNQTAAQWGNIQAPAERVGLYWLLGNALLDYPSPIEDKAIEQYAQILAEPTVEDELRALILNNQGWAYYQKAYSPRNTSTLDAQTTQTTAISATVAFRGALQINTTYAIAWVNLGETYTRLADYDAALDSCVQALMVAGNFAPAFVCKARVHMVRNEFDIAIVEATNALETDNNYALAYYFIGLGYCKQGNNLEATEINLQLFLDRFQIPSRWERAPNLRVNAQKLIDKIEQDKQC